MSRFDVPIKSVFRENSRGYVASLVFGPSHPVEWLDVQQPIVSNRLGDSLARTSDGGLVHIEFQSRNDPDMPFRMLDYYVGYRRIYGEGVRQVLVYIGPQPLRMAAEFVDEHTRHSFRVVNVRDLDGEQLLATGDWGDSVLAILTTVDREKVIQAVLTHLQRLDGQDQQDAKATFVLISGIMGLADEVSRRLDFQMINVMENEVIGPMILKALAEARQEAREEARRESVASMLCLLLEERFGPLVPATRKIVESADEATLQRWIKRFVTAPSLTAVLE